MVNTNLLQPLLGGGGRGSGFALGPAQNEFADAAARDTYAGGNAAWLAEYNADRSFWIRVGGAAGNIQRRNAAGNGWENVTGVVSGPRGARGNPGSDAAVNAANVDPLIQAYRGGIAGLTLDEPQIPAGIARDSEVTAAIDGLVNGAPGGLNTLDELAQAMNDDPAFHATVSAALNARQTVDQVNQLIADYLAASVMGNTEEGILVTFLNGKFNFVVRESPRATLYFGTSDDAVPTGAELTIAGAGGAGTIRAYAGSKHHLIARLASEPDIASVRYSDDQSNTNQIGAFTKYRDTVVPSGEIAAYSVWVSNQALTQAEDVTLTVV